MFLSPTIWIFFGSWILLSVGVGLFWKIHKESFFKGLLLSILLTPLVGFISYFLKQAGDNKDAFAEMAREKTKRDNLRH